MPEHKSSWANSFLSIPTAAAAIYVPLPPRHAAYCTQSTAQDADTNCIQTICNSDNLAMVKAQTFGKDNSAVALLSRKRSKVQVEFLRLSWRSYPALRAPWLLSQFPALSILSLRMITSSFMISMKMSYWHPLLSVLLLLNALYSILTYQKQPHHGALKAFSAPLRRCTFM